MNSDTRKSPHTDQRPDAMDDAGEKAAGNRLGPLCVAALGVVYGDIGTSPLYAFRESFLGVVTLAPTDTNLFGVLSLIFWSLMIVISLKYLTVVMRADNNGEGGIIALVSLLRPRTAKPRSLRGGMILAGLFGAALLYGDGTITPAISVLSAVEGLTIATNAFEPVVVPITIAVLIGLFAVQRRGTHAIGNMFGPIIMLWFVVLAVLGINGIAQEPRILAALSPHYAVAFIAANGIDGFLVLGAVFLVVTGGETLYADMGHFGPRPIRVTWFGLVLPALLLNYFGQGALILGDRQEITHPFYHLAPSWALYPLVILATTAAVIASQAVISGVFSLTRQAIQLGQLPRMRVIQTHGEEFGQIYIPVVNWGLMLATIGLVLGFRSSSSLASAYGVAISTDMVITTVLIFFVARRWGWNVGGLLLMTGAFLAVDLSFFAANLLKVVDGGWYPLVVGAAIFTVMTTWRRGGQLLKAKLRREQLPIGAFIERMEKDPVVRTPGTAVFMTADETATPPILLHHIEHNRALHETVILLHVAVGEVPRIPASERLVIEGFGPGYYRVVVRYGFMQAVNVPVALRLCEKFGLTVDPEAATFYLGRETLLPSDAHPGMALWRDRLFAFMAQNASHATAFYNIPSDRVVELGLQVKI